MAFLNMNCPNCNKKIPIDDTSENCFCIYCGASFWVQDEMQRFQDKDNWGYHASKWKQSQQKYRDQVDPLVNVICAIVTVIGVITIVWILITMAFN